MSKVLAFAVAAVLSCAVQALTINFDVTADSLTPIEAPETFGEAASSSLVGPSVTAFSPLGVHFDGGVILAGARFHNPSNLLATSDFAYLADNTMLPGTITIHFDFAVTAVSMRVINGYEAGTFDVTADTGERVSLSLTGYMTAGDSGTVIIRGDAMNSLVVTSSQLPGNRHFGIDDLQATPVPEPAATAPLVAGSLLLAGRMRRRK